LSPHDVALKFGHGECLRPARAPQSDAEAEGPTVDVERRHGCIARLVNSGGDRARTVLMKRPGTCFVAVHSVARSFES
jgi:hypothetical protein